MADETGDNDISKAKKARKRGKQQAIPGTERAEQVKHKDVERAAEEYVNIRDQRMALTEQEVQLRDQLTELMQKHQLQVYYLDDLSPPAKVELTAKYKAKVARQGSTTPDDDDE